MEFDMNVRDSIILIAIYAIVLAIIIFVTIIKKWYKLDHKNLFSQELFWIAILTPVFSFIYFGIFSWLGHAPQVDSKGMGNFLEISKLPLILLASAVPLGAIVTNLHRTYQVEAQIKTAEAKNLLDGYYAHNKYYIECFGKININRRIMKSKIEKLEDVNSLTLSVSQPHTLYKKLYPASSPVSGPQYSPSNSQIRKITSLTNNILLNFEKLDHDYFVDKLNSNFSLDDEMFRIIRLRIRALTSYLCVNENIKDIEFVDVKSRTTTLCLATTLQRFRLACIKLSEFLIELLDIYGVTKKSHPELIDKVKRLRICTRESRKALSEAKSSIITPTIRGVLTDINLNDDHLSNVKSSNSNERSSVQVETLSSAKS